MLDYVKDDHEFFLKKQRGIQTKMAPNTKFAKLKFKEESHVKIFIGESQVGV